MVLNGTTDIDPIPLVPPKQSSRDVYPPGAAMQIFGFGHIDEEDTTISDQLQRGSITLWPKANCFSYLAQFCGYASRWDNDAMLCAFDEDTSTEQSTRRQRRRRTDERISVRHQLVLGTSQWFQLQNDVHSTHLKRTVFMCSASM